MRVLEVQYWAWALNLVCEVAQSREFEFEYWVCGWKHASLWRVRETQRIVIEIVFPIVRMIDPWVKVKDPKIVSWDPIVMNKNPHTWVGHVSYLSPHCIVPSCQERLKPLFKYPKLILTSSCEFLLVYRERESKFWLFMLSPPYMWYVDTTLVMFFMQYLVTHLSRQYRLYNVNKFGTTLHLSIQPKLSPLSSPTLPTLAHNPWHTHQLQLHGCYLTMICLRTLLWHDQALCLELQHLNLEWHPCWSLGSSMRWAIILGMTTCSLLNTQTSCCIFVEDFLKYSYRPYYVNCQEAKSPSYSVLFLSHDFEECRGPTC